MISEKLVARSYLLTENSQEHKLEYFIFSEAHNEINRFGVIIKQYTGAIMKTSKQFIANNERDAANLIDFFAKNFVFPCSLHEIAEDMRLQKALLEVY